MRRYFQWLLAVILFVTLFTALGPTSAQAASASHINATIPKTVSSSFPTCGPATDGYIYTIGGNRYQCGCVVVDSNLPCVWVWRNLDVEEYTTLQLDRSVLITNGPKAKLYFQPDGNLVVYDEFGRPRWSSHTLGRGNTVSFQPDGNFVVYDGGGRPSWAANTCCWSGNKLDIQSDGNVVIYNPFFIPLWSTNTSH